MHCGKSKWIRGHRYSVHMFTLFSSLHIESIHLDHFGKRNGSQTRRALNEKHTLVLQYFSWILALLFGVNFRNCGYKSETMMKYAALKSIGCC